MDLLLDENWDLSLGATDLQLVTGAAAIGQHWAQRLKTFMGEWFLDLRIGLPYFQQVLVKNPDPVVLDSVFKAATIATPGIVELLEFELEIEARTRELRLRAKARADEGAAITFNEVLP